MLNELDAALSSENRYHDPESTPPDNDQQQADAPMDRSIRS